VRITKSFAAWMERISEGNGGDAPGGDFSLIGSNGNSSGIGRLLRRTVHAVPSPARAIVAGAVFLIDWLALGYRVSGVLAMLGRTASWLLRH
jgi:hypothetical protein